MRVKAVVCSVLFLACAGVPAAHAAPQGATTQCPQYIAEKKGGLFFPKRNFKCFPSARSAKRAGFFSGAATQAIPNYTGWWRFGFKQVSSNCATAADLGNTATIFLQIKHDGTGIFGGLCPLVGNRYVGPVPPAQSLAQEQGFTISSRIQTRGDAECGGTTGETVYNFEARDFDSTFTKTTHARFTAVKTCADPRYGTFRCSTVWEGQGGRETPDHRFWPDVPDDTSEFGNTCAVALTKCSGCHG